MTVKRFVGASARECLRRVKEELGPDAVVISNKPVDAGVEIVAMTPESLDAISQQAAVPRAAVSPARSAPSAPVSAQRPKVPEDDYTVTLSSAARKSDSSFVRMHITGRLSRRLLPRPLRRRAPACGHCRRAHRQNRMCSLRLRLRPRCVRRANRLCSPRPRRRQRSPR